MALICKNNFSTLSKYLQLSFLKCNIRLNSMKCFNKTMLISVRRIFVDDQSAKCSYKKIYDQYKHSTILPLGTCIFTGRVNSLRFQTTQTSFDELKLEQFLKHLSLDSLDQLEAKYGANLMDDKMVIYLLKEKDKLEENVKELESMKKKEENSGNNKEMMDLIEGDLAQYRAGLTEIYEKIIDIIVPREEFEDCNDILLEISAGVGGSEAQLFANELFNMYCSFLENKGWEYSVAEKDDSDLGGVRHCSLLVSGPGAFSTLQHEGGVHRVQRVPETEKGSRMHTSTVTVAVLPQPSDVEIDVKESDLRIETKRASGAGGQHVNTTDSAVRITHLPSGIIVECQTDRSQVKNRETALKKLKAKLYERELNKRDTLQRSQRKSQVGTSARSEKIRTYNFRDDRISDHRLSQNLHNLKDFLQGGDQFEKLLEHLVKQHHESQIKHFVDSLPG